MREKKVETERAAAAAVMNTTSTTNTTMDARRGTMLFLDHAEQINWTEIGDEIFEAVRDEKNWDMDRLEDILSD
jgi:hypothetical protein